MRLIRTVVLTVSLATAVNVSGAGVLRQLFTQDETSNFKTLSVNRDNLIRQISDLNEEIAALNRDIATLDPHLIQSKLSDAQTALSNLKSTDQAYAERKKALEQLQNDLQNDLKRSSQALAERAADVQKLNHLEEDLKTLDVEIRVQMDRASTLSQYTVTICIAFTILVLVVIIGFFVIAVKSRVAYIIFSGSEGMQFLTLFLIVIAIILFGIMGTLEGKELAALLGGLSGYILGRSSTTSGTNSGAADRAAQDQAAGNQITQDEAAKDQAAKDQAAKDQALQDQAAKDQAAKNQTAEDEAAKGEAAEKEGAK